MLIIGYNPGSKIFKQLIATRRNKLLTDDKVDVKSGKKNAPPLAAAATPRATRCARNWWLLGMIFTLKMNRGRKFSRWMEKYCVCATRSNSKI